MATRIQQGQLIQTLSQTFYIRLVPLIQGQVYDEKSHITLLRWLPPWLDPITHPLDLRLFHLLCLHQLFMQMKGQTRFLRLLN